MENLLETRWKTENKILQMEVAPRKIDDATSLYHKLYVNSTTMWTLMAFQQQTLDYENYKKPPEQKQG